MIDESLKKLCLTVFYFCKSLKMREKLLWNPQFLFCFILYKGKMLTDKSWNRRWARSVLIAYVYYTSLWRKVLIEREKKGVNALDSCEVFLYYFKTKEDLNGRIIEGKKEISV